jgi:hypothetical protein
VRTQKEIAEAYGVNIRTVKRWSKAGVDIQSDTAIKQYREECVHPGKFEDDTQRETPAVSVAHAEQPVERPAAVVQANYDFSSIDRLIKSLSEMAAKAASDLEAARTSGRSERIVRVASQTFADSMRELRQALVQREKVEQSQVESYPLSDVLAVFARFAQMLRWMSFEAIPTTICNELENSALVDPLSRAAVEDVVSRAIKNGLFPAISDFGAALPDFLLDVKREISLDDRQKLNSHLGKFIKCDAK